MSPHYIIRFDDICPTMNWSIWDRIEPILNAYSIKPILAVVPENRDPTLIVSPERSDFWQRLKVYQKSGWFIALHGYQHLYLTKGAGLVGIIKRSEFSGLPEDIQREKLVKAISIFARHGICPDGWVAPWHSFDATTVKILVELGINVVIDGFFTRPVEYLDARWIPQQLWQFRKMPGGLWTVCLHVNNYTESELLKLQRDIEAYASAITSVDRVLREYRFPRKNIFDHVFAVTWLNALRLKIRLRKNPSRT